MSAPRHAEHAPNRCLSKIRPPYAFSSHRVVYHVAGSFILHISFSLNNPFQYSVVLCYPKAMSVALRSFVLITIPARFFTLSACDLSPHIFKINPEEASSAI